MPSTSMEDYLKAIYYLQGRSNGARVRTSEIADHLDVTSPTVTSMFTKLASRGYIDHEKYYGASLTEEGERVALRILRNHRLLEAYLTTELGYQLSEVHEEADQLEHHISDRLGDRLAEKLDDPETDPHGAPIPTPSLQLIDTHTGEMLTTFDEGATVTIQEVSDRDEALLEYLSEYGIVPGTSITIEEVAPFGMRTIRTHDSEETVSLPDAAARLIWAIPTAESTAEEIRRA
jgi:DtxR family transcriptional regulator, Mn-dependent transcriptional regulator